MRTVGAKEQNGWPRSRGGRAGTPDSFVVKKHIDHKQIDLGAMLPPKGQRDQAGVGWGLCSHGPKARLLPHETTPKKA